MAQVYPCFACSLELRAFPAVLDLPRLRTGINSFFAGFRWEFQLVFALCNESLPKFARNRWALCRKICLIHTHGANKGSIDLSRTESVRTWRSWCQCWLRPVSDLHCGKSVHRHRFPSCWRTTFRPVHVSRAWRFATPTGVLRILTLVGRISGMDVGSPPQQSQRRRGTSYAVCSWPGCSWMRTLLRSNALTNRPVTAFDEDYFQDVHVIEIFATEIFFHQGLRLLRWQHSQSLRVLC